VFKTDICKAWEDSGNCRYNSKCQVRSRHNYYEFNSSCFWLFDTINNK
jgi:hypothetical protein